MSYEETRTRFKALHRQKAVEVKRATRRDRRNFYRRKVEHAEEAAVRGNQLELFKISKEIGGTRKTYNGVIDDANGNKLTTNQERTIVGRNISKTYCFVLNLKCATHESR